MVKEFTGVRYGLLVGEKAVGKMANGAVVWEFKCDCGNSVIGVPGNIRNKVYKMCSECAEKLKKDIPPDAVTQKYIGRRFGNAVATKFLYRTRSRQMVWLFKCDCGNEFEASLHSFKAKKIQACPQCCSDWEEIPTSLCFDCSVYHNCSWVLNFKPVEGWEAKRTGVCGGSYCVSACPNFKPDEAR